MNKPFKVKIALRILLILLAFMTGCDDSPGKANGGVADAAGGVAAVETAGSGVPTFTVVDTHQARCYDALSEIQCPGEDEGFFGQDAHYIGTPAWYTDNGDGTITDHNTGLMWQQDPGEKMTYNEAVAGMAAFRLAGYDDWRLPTIKELYSLIRFNGTDPSGHSGDDAGGLIPFMDTDYFSFQYGDPAAGERIIDSQWATCTEYADTTMGGDRTMFGVNFADGRIKGYPLAHKTFFVLYVRGNPDYGNNAFADNTDGTITDAATGLMWQQNDSGPHDWREALSYCEALQLAGRDDWRLPNAKELQSIVDYSRSPDTSGSAALDPLFTATPIINEAGGIDYPYYWTATTHANDSAMPGGSAVYIAFGRALGYMGRWMDVHGAGAQRSDPKQGDPGDYPYGRGPQGDAVRIDNYVRCVCEIR